MDSSFCLPILDQTASTATVYSFSNVDRELAQHLGWTLASGGSFDLAGDLVRGAVRIPHLEIAVLDSAGKELQVEVVNGSGVGNPNVAFDTRYPWLLYYPVSSSTAGAVLLRQRSFNIIMKIDDEALRQANSIHLRLVS
jgi:hypothetical protein